MIILPWSKRKSSVAGNVDELAPTSLSLTTLSGLEQEIHNLREREGTKEYLLKQAEYRKDFHGSVSLFIANYTLGVSHNFGYALEHDKPVEPWQVEQLGYFARRIKNNGEQNSDYTLRRCTAAEKLQRIIESKPETMDEAAQVIGYLDRGTSKINHIFSGFHFFYEHDHDNLHPKVLFDSYKGQRLETEALGLRARDAFNSLSHEVQDSLIRWIGQYGHTSLQEMTRTTIDFKDNKPDRITNAKILPNIPAAPLLGKDTFYKRFGEDLLRGYGLISRT